MYSTTKMFRVYTRDLQNKGTLKMYMSLGFQHIRRVISLERFPTIGSLAELCVAPNVGTVPIDSPQGRRLINKLAYI